ncbi:T9SS type A sorting domain-containing protein [Winogradskyella luteola]|uniref:T9SS type A sorting domain-containing protein n=1 Tax=Winogradskyella luteola TaxID=2828330 RepID=A0A9X1JQJ6_9FLAO|nr:T9SS type A sorting domain-containing protein [Winogradskyella luteola]MBV7267652.1 T9SS type A sorting domain-containing protein [Winogradskyella luteola]
MKRTLLTFLAFFMLYAIPAQIVLNQSDDFEDGTEQNWFEAVASGAPAENIDTGGPSGDDDNYLRDYTTQNPGGAGSRLIVRNLTQWIGNYTSAGVGSILMDVRALNVDVSVRVSLTGPGGNFSSPAVVVTAGSGWGQITIPISETDMISAPAGNDGSAEGTDINATLSGVTEIRILSNPNPSWIGEVTNAEMHLDNITAGAPLSASNFRLQNTEFIISPNPAKNKLTIKLPVLDTDSKLEVFDVLGKRIYRGSINQLESSIDVSNWRSGIYLVRVSNDKTTQTKRFIKQ